MSERLQSDGLEEYLSRSFEQHEPEPSSEVWGRIQEDLGQQKVANLRSRRRRLLRIAAILIPLLVFGNLVYLNYHLHSTIKKTAENTERIEHINDSAPGLQAIPGEETTNDTESTDTQMNRLPEGELLKGGVAAQKAIIEGGALPEGGQKTGGPAPPGEAVAERLPPDPLFNQVPARPNTERKSIGEIAELPNGIYPIENALPKIVYQGDRAEVHPVVDLATLPMKALDYTSSPIIPTPKPIEPTQRSGFGIGVNAGSFSSWGKIRVNGFGPIGGPGPMPFVAESERNGRIDLVGVTLDVPVVDHWQFRTGVDWRQLSFTETHQPKFKLRDRTGTGSGGGPGGGKPTHDFEYNLNTTSGTISLEFRVEQSDDEQPLPDEEEVELEVETSQRTHYVSIPMGVARTFGKGRTRFFVEAGLVTNVLISEQSAIDKINSLSPKFRVDSQGPRRSRLTETQDLSIDFQASAGVEYAVGPNLAVRLEPTYLKSLSNRLSHPFLEANRSSLGVTAGAVYNF